MVPYKIVRADNGDAWVEVGGASCCCVWGRGDFIYQGSGDFTLLPLLP
jgi:hypothetical protein